MQPFVIAFIGYSGSGKTTLLARLTAHFARRGFRVGLIKHTHHTPRRGGARRGDTGLFLDSGAAAVILAGEPSAVMWTADSDVASRVWEFSDATELIATLGTELVMIEGYKGRLDWPRILVRRTEAEKLDVAPETIIAVATDEPPGTHAGRVYSLDDVEGIASLIEELWSR
jgi:molybdopterin-guanine dinucleotide biosynthesis adapter protein